jgi:hypothetical protein
LWISSRTFLTSRCADGAEENFGEVQLRICNTCMTSLKSSSKTPPMLSIRNGFAIGALPPDLEDSTAVEVSMCSRVRIVGTFRTLVGGNRGLRGHAISLHTSPESVLNSLPRPQETAHEIIQVVLVGAATPDQVAASKQPCIVRSGRVRHLMQFFMNSNRLYSQVSLNEPALAALPDSSVAPGTFVEERDAEHADRYQQSFSSHAYPDAPNQQVPVESQNLRPLVHNSFLMAERTAGTDREHLQEDVAQLLGADLNVDREPSERAQLLVVRSGSEIVREHMAETLTMQFPELFPFGFGGPDDPTRIVPVSKEACVRHYLRLPSRKFSTHGTFLLVAFDQISRAQGMRNAWLTAQVPNNQVQNFAFVTREEMQATVQHIVEVNRQIRLGISIDAPPQMGLANRLLRAVKGSRKKMYATNEERGKSRNQIWSMANTLGSPSLFVTINPYDNGSVELRRFMNLPRNYFDNSTNPRAEM